MNAEPQTLAERIADIRERAAGAAARAGRPADAVRIIGASKTHGPDAIRAAFELGITDFGENRIQEGVPKIEALAAEGVRPVWHFIGHLQTNKAGKAIQHFDIIQSVDSLHLAKELSRRATTPIRIMLELNLGNEGSKAGFPFTSEAAFIETAAPILQLPNISVTGLMTVAPISERAEDARPYFRTLAGLAAALNLPELSMGMTGDFEVAIEEGATMVRVGRALFGPRT